MQEGDGEEANKEARLLAGDLLHSITFDDVAFLDVVELLHGHAALVVLGDLLGVGAQLQLQAGVTRTEQLRTILPSWT